MNKRPIYQCTLPPILPVLPVPPYYLYSLYPPYYLYSLYPPYYLYSLYPHTTCTPCTPHTTCTPCTPTHPYSIHSEILAWVKSISNHLWWSMVTTVTYGPGGGVPVGVVVPLFRTLVTPSSTCWVLSGESSRASLQVLQHNKCTQLSPYTQQCTYVQYQGVYICAFNVWACTVHSMCGCVLCIQCVGVYIRAFNVWACTSMHLVTGCGHITPIQYEVVYLHRHTPGRL